MLFPIIDCAEDKLLLVCGKCINVLVTTYGVLLQFLGLEVIISALYCYEN